MKRTYLTVAALLCCTTGAWAVVMPTLTPVPGTPKVWTQSNGGADLYLFDQLGSYFFIGGVAASPVGDDYYQEGTITFHNICELGFIARADFNNGKTYECSFNPEDGYFNLVKVTGFTTFVNLANVNTGILPPEDAQFKIGFSANTEGANVRLKGWLYESDGDLVASFDYLDDGTKGGSSYIGGALGTWAFKSTPQFLEGTWTGMRVIVPEPATMGLVGLGALLMLRRRK